MGNPIALCGRTAAASMPVRCEQHSLSGDQINQFVGDAKLAQMESEMSTMDELNTMEDLESFDGD